MGVANDLADHRVIARLEAPTGESHASEAVDEQGLLRRRVDHSVQEAHEVGMAINSLRDRGFHESEFVVAFFENLDRKLEASHFALVDLAVPPFPSRCRSHKLMQSTPHPCSRSPQQTKRLEARPNDRRGCCAGSCGLLGSHEAGTG